MAYNLFATDKQKNYPGAQVQPQPVQQPQQVVQQPLVQTPQPQQNPQLEKRMAEMNLGINPSANPYYAEILKERMQRGYKTPSINQNDPTSGMNALSQMYTSPEQEEKLRKASVNNQRIMAVADALRHIGNIYNTVNYAPAQQLNSPVQEEQQRYEKGKAVRDAANLKYYTYQQAKAAQDAKQKQWEREFEAKAQRWNAEFGLKAYEAEGKGKLREAQIARQNMLNEIDQLRKDGIISDNKYKELRNKYFPEVQKSTIRKNNAATQNSIASAAKTRWQMSGGGGAGKGEKPIVIQGKTGTYKVSGWNDKTYKSFIDQAYYALSNMKGKDGKPMIDNAAVTGSFTSGVFGGRNINDSAKQEAVNNAILKHPEAGDFIREVYGFDFESRPGYNDGSVLQATPQTNGTLFSTPWNTGSPSVGGRSLGTGIGSNSNNNGGKKLGVGL